MCDLAPEASGTRAAGQKNDIEKHFQVLACLYPNGKILCQMVEVEQMKTKKTSLHVRFCLFLCVNLGFCVVFSSVESTVVLATP